MYKAVEEAWEREQVEELEAPIVGWNIISKLNLPDCYSWLLANVGVGLMLHPSASTLEKISVSMWLIFETTRLDEKYLKEQCYVIWFNPLVSKEKIDNFNSKFGIECV